MTALLTDNLPLLASAPNGIKKLRELILELAVRGKLVPQDPNDEPANELLKRITEEKARLVASGKIKKPKRLEEIGKEEWPFVLPVGWEWSRLGNVSEYIQRGKGPAYVDQSDFRVVSQKCVRWTGLDLQPARFIEPESLVKYESIRFLRSGDILWNSTGTGTIGRACVVETCSEDQQLVADSHVTVVRPTGLLPVFLWRWIQSPSVQSELEGNASGTTNQIELNTSTVITHLTPVPPIAEQHRVVAKIDELMALCDRLEAQQAGSESAHAQLVQAMLDSLAQASDAIDFAANWRRLAEHFRTLFTTEPSIDALKRVILELAVMGKLSAPHQDDTSVAEILKKMAEDKSNKGPKEQENERHLKSYLASIENNRATVRADFICGFITKGTTPAKNHLLPDGEIPFLKVYNIIENKIDFHYRPTFIPKEVSHKELGRSKAYPGDVVMNIVGPPLGKVAIIPEHFPEWNMNQALSVFRAKSGILNKYIYYMLLSDSVLKSVISESKGSAGQNNLSLAQCRALLIPIPSTEEQHRIVAKVDLLMALCDQLKVRLNQARELNEQLASTLVEQAVA